MTYVRIFLFALLEKLLASNDVQAFKSLETDSTDTT